MEEKDGRQKALELTLSQLTKRYGDGVVMKLGSAPGMDVEIIPTGSLGAGHCPGRGGHTQGQGVGDLRP